MPVLQQFLILLLLMAVSSEVFGVVFLNGFLKELKIAKVLFTAFIISLINAVMGLMGLITGYGLNLLLDSFIQWLSVVIILMLGLKIMIKSFKPKFHEMTWELHRIPVLAGFSTAVGINTYLAGMALSSFKLTGQAVFMLLLAIYFLIPILGFLAGRKSKNFFVAARAGIAGGIILIGISVYFTLNFFGIV